MASQIFTQNQCKFTRFSCFIVIWFYSNLIKMGNKATFSKVLEWSRMTCILKSTLHLKPMAFENMKI